MVTAAQAAANVATATRVLARQMGLYANTGAGFSYGDLAPAAQIALTNALAAYIQAHPALFDTGASDLTNPVKSAVLASNDSFEGTGYEFGEFIDTALASGRAVNPFDASNLPTIGRWVFWGALFLGGLYILFKLPPTGRAGARA